MRRKRKGKPWKRSDVARQWALARLRTSLAFRHLTTPFGKPRHDFGVHQSSPAGLVSPDYANSMPLEYPTVGLSIVTLES